MGKQDGRPGKSLRNPLNMLKKFRVGGGAKNWAQSGNLKHTIFYFRPDAYWTCAVHADKARL